MSDKRKPMTGDELDAIQGRLAAITEWPWIAFCRTGVRHRMGITNKRLFDDGDAPEVLDVVELGEDAGGIKSKADAAFIANAPTDIARLLAEVERLRKEHAWLLQKDFEPSYVVKDGDGFTVVDVLSVAAYPSSTAAHNAAHIATNSPDVVKADIKEILRLREEVARLNKEADWFIEYILDKEIFRCPMPEGYRCEHKRKHICFLDSEETEIRRRCWREVASKAVEEENG